MIHLEGGCEQVQNYHLGFQGHQRSLLLDHCLQLFHKKISLILNRGHKCKKEPVGEM